jgi:hypothetical protein
MLHDKYLKCLLLGLTLLAAVAFFILYLPEEYSEIAFNDRVELQFLNSKENPPNEGN